MNIKVKVYDICKYNPNSKKVAEVVYNNVVSSILVTYTDEEIFSMGFDEVDDYKEYYILTLENNETCTFRNSYIDAFRV